MSSNYSEWRTYIHALATMYVRSARREPELPKVPALCVAAAPYKGLRPLRRFAAIPSLRVTTEHHFQTVLPLAERSIFYHHDYKEALK